MKRSRADGGGDDILLMLSTYCPQNKKLKLCTDAIRKMNNIERNLEQKLLSYSRVKFAHKSESRTLTRVLRVFVRWEFFSGNDTEKPHYSIFAEGTILDPSLQSQWKFGSFFDRIRIHSDKKVIPSQVLECSTLSNISPDGADCYKFKVYYDKAASIKVALHRNCGLKPRFEISPKLRQIIPGIRIDPTEDDVLLCIWTYIQTHNLFTKRIVRCDEALKDLFGLETVTVTHIRNKIAEHLLPLKPIMIDLNMSPNTFKSSSVSNSKLINGRTFDLEVDILDDHDSSIIDIYNDITRLQDTNEDANAQLRLRQRYIAEQISQRLELEQKYESEINKLDSILSGDVVQDNNKDNNNNNTISHAPSSISENGNDVATEGGVPKDMLILSDPSSLLKLRKSWNLQDHASLNPYRSNTQGYDSSINPNNSSEHIIWSGIHSYRGYVDINDTSAFATRLPRPSNESPMKAEAVDNMR